jgi:hypothetical protein
MAKGGSKIQVPTGMRKLEKKRGSEKNTTHKACWYARCEDAPKGEKWVKFSMPFTPKCALNN